MSRQSQQKSTTAAGTTRRGVEGRESKSKASDGRTEPRIKSVLIEPRHNEPPRVSVSVEYSEKAPSLKALQKAAMETIHEVVELSEGDMVDLGERQNVQRGELTKCFSVEPKASARKS